MKNRKHFRKQMLKFTRVIKTIFVSICSSIMAISLKAIVEPATVSLSWWYSPFHPILSESSLSTIDSYLQISLAVFSGLFYLIGVWRTDDKPVNYWLLKSLASNVFLMLGIFGMLLFLSVMARIFETTHLLLIPPTPVLSNNIMLFSFELTFSVALGVFYFISVFRAKDDDVFNIEI